MNGIRGAAIGVLAAFLAAPLSAQVEMPRLTQSIDVRVTNVDVVVVDSQGKRVRGLTRDDFEVSDGGVRQPITNFSEFVTEEPRTAGAEEAAERVAPAPDVAAPPRHLVIFFDSVSTTRAQRLRLAPAVLQFVRGLRDEDEAMVVSWNRSLRIFVQPTNDRALLEEGVKRATSEISLSSERLTMFTDLTVGAPNPLSSPPGASASQRAQQALATRRQIREAAYDLNESILGLNGVLMRLAGVSGRKALILVSTAFSFHPGGEDVGEEDVDALEWVAGVDAPRLLKTLADSANAAGVPIYGIHAAELDSGMSAAEGGSGVSAFSSAAPSLRNIRSASGGVDGLTYLAARTGGLAAGNVNYFNAAFDNISHDLGNYYSIGYRSPDATIDLHRKVDVKIRGGRYLVRARRGAIDRSPESEISDRVMAALLFPSSATNQLGISANVRGVTSAGRNRVKVPVDVKVPLARLAFQSDGTGRLSADLTVLIASSDLAGSVSRIERFRPQIRTTRREFSTLSKRFYTYGLDVDLKTRQAKNRFAIAVFDNVAKDFGIVTIEVMPE